MRYTSGHCQNNNQPGGCQLHNLQCQWPDCDRQPITPPYLQPDWVPTSKQDVVDLLLDVQAGHVSCRKASDLLFPQFKRQEP